MKPGFTSREPVNFMGGSLGGAYVLFHDPRQPTAMFNLGKVVYDNGGPLLQTEYFNEATGEFIWTNMRRDRLILGFVKENQTVSRRDTMGKEEKIKTLDEVLKRNPFYLEMRAVSTYVGSLPGTYIFPETIRGTKLRKGPIRKPVTPVAQAGVGFVRKNGSDEALEDFFNPTREYIMRAAFNIAYKTFRSTALAVDAQKVRKFFPDTDWLDTFMLNEATPHYRDVWVRYACTFMDLKWWRYTEVAHLTEYMNEEETKEYEAYLDKLQAKKGGSK